MPLSKQISSHNLIPGMKYLVDIQWNITNDLRLPTNHIVTGTFIGSSFVKGRTLSFDSGLQVLRSRSRYEMSFLIDGEPCKLSSANKIYEIISPSPREIAGMCKLYKLPFHNDIKKYIYSFTGIALNLKYRAKPKGKY
tara:strand:- start:327 stop:740 length:414 start_codon:yes stop_codon:yes gene_type:complete